MDILEELKADSLPNDFQHQREARTVLARMHIKAHDEIERLRQQVAELEEALKQKEFREWINTINCEEGEGL